MLPKQLLLLCFAVATSRAQSSTQSSTSASSTAKSSVREDKPDQDDRKAPVTLSFSQTIETVSAIAPQFTGSEYTYASYGTQITLDLTSSSSSNGTATVSGTHSQSSTSTTAPLLTIVGGNTGTTTATGTASSTISSIQATNTVPCNGHPEFCNRQYSNITQVCAHNSAFSIRNNAASNQWFDTEIQLNDGARMIQGETHWVNNTVYMCHTSCDLLNAGPWVNQLKLIKNWLDRNPFEVVTILVVNSDFKPVEDYVPAVEESGILPYLFEPDRVPLRRDEWPTLGELILKGKRCIMFMDYQANQKKVPYILEEFIHMWETPFSPTNDNFPCTQQRPPHLNQTKARDEFMYMANHNLNVAVNLGALTGGSGVMGHKQILIPAVSQLNNTNGAFNETGQVEQTRLECTDMWGRPPNFLLVDYYNFGEPHPGSVFEVAARANGVEYNRNCCGARSSAAPGRLSASLISLGLAMGLAIWFL